MPVHRLPAQQACESLKRAAGSLLEKAIPLRSPSEVASEVIDFWALRRMSEDDLRGAAKCGRLFQHSLVFRTGTVPQFLRVIRIKNIRNFREFDGVPSGTLLSPTDGPWVQTSNVGDALLRGGRAVLPAVRQLWNNVYWNNDKVTSRAANLIHLSWDPMWDIQRGKHQLTRAALYLKLAYEKQGGVLARLTNGATLKKKDSYSDIGGPTFGGLIYHNALDTICICDNFERLKVGLTQLAHYTLVDKDGIHSEPLAVVHTNLPHRKLEGGRLGHYLAFAIPLEVEGNLRKNRDGYYHFYGTIRPTARERAKAASFCRRGDWVNLPYDWDLHPFVADPIVITMGILRFYLGDNHGVSVLDSSLPDNRYRRWFRYLLFSANMDGLKPAGSSLNGKQGKNMLRILLDSLQDQKGYSTIQNFYNGLSDSLASFARCKSLCASIRARYSYLVDGRKNSFKHSISFLEDETIFKGKRAAFITRLNLWFSQQVLPEVCPVEETYSAESSLSYSSRNF